MGVYNGDDPTATPTLFTCFPSTARTGWSCALHFTADGHLYVGLFDDAANFISQVTYAGVHRNAVGLYLQTPAGVSYSQDWRDGGLPQVLSYQSSFEVCSIYQCFEAMPYAAGTSRFVDEVVDVQQMLTTCILPVRRSTWGRLKSSYR